MEFVAELVIRGTPAIRGDRQNMNAHYIKGIVRQNADGDDEVVYGQPRSVLSEDALNGVIGQLHAQALEVIAAQESQIAQLQAEVQALRMQLAALQPAEPQQA